MTHSVQQTNYSTNVSFYFGHTVYSFPTVDFARAVELIVLEIVPSDYTLNATVCFMFVSTERLFE